MACRRNADYPRRNRQVYIDRHSQTPNIKATADLRST